MWKLVTQSAVSRSTDVTSWLELENECLFALRCDRNPPRPKQKKNIKPTFQLSDKMTVCDYVFFSFRSLTLNSPRTYIWCQQNKNKTREEKRLLRRRPLRTQETQRLHKAMNEDRADIASWWLQGFLLLRSSPSARLQLSQKSSKKLTKGSTVRLFVWKK